MSSSYIIYIYAGTYNQSIKEKLPLLTQYKAAAKQGKDFNMTEKAMQTIRVTNFQQ